MTKGVEKPGWVPHEQFIEHLKLFPMPCIDLLVDVKGNGIVWGRRLNPPMKGMLATFGVRVLMTDNSWEELLKRVAKEEIGLDIDPKSCVFVGQQLVRFDQEKDGIERLDLTTCWAITVESSTRLTPNPRNYDKLVISSEIPDQAGEMYQRFVRQYFQSRF